MCVFPCCLVCCSRYHPPHLTGQTHLQPLSNHVDCYKAAGTEADGASEPDRRTEWGRCRSRVRATWALRRGIYSSVEGYCLLIAPLVEGYCCSLLPQWRDSVTVCFRLNIK